MRIWLPYPDTGGGADVFYDRLATGLTAHGHRVFAQRIPRRLQFCPWPLRYLARPEGIDVAITNIGNAFVLGGLGFKLVAIEHHCVLDPSYKPHRSISQALYHETLTRYFETQTLQTADAIVAVSQYTADSLHAALGGPRPHTIPNGIETDFFTPGADLKQPLDGRPARLLFVGNLIHRKGADLLPKIMGQLGSGFELRYTSGLRTNDPFDGTPGMIPLGRLTTNELRDEYRGADLLLFPTRFEGFGYAAAEALACGTPVVATRCSSLPEVVQDGVTGQLCPLDDVDGFANAVRRLTASDEHLLAMSRAARADAAERFSLEKMASGYAELLQAVTRCSVRRLQAAAPAMRSDVRAALPADAQEPPS